MVLGNLLPDAKQRPVETTVWLTEEHAPPTLYCDCTEEEQVRWKVEADGRCESCGHMRKS
jgi:hypothetical protein